MAALKMLLDPTKLGAEAETLSAGLRKRIVGQDAAIREIVDVYQTWLTGMSTEGRPIGNFLFLGPTGSGKTRTVEAVAETLVGDARAVIKIDCAEFQHGHEIAKLIGSPPGYLGHRETRAMLSQEALNQYHTDTVKLSFVLFDEIEKASDALWNLLLGILDKATLTLGDNRRVDFSNALIFLTGNVGASEMEALLRPNLGFAAVARVEEADADGVMTGKVARAGVDAARRRFAPEFMNRIDKVVVFNPLGKTELRDILSLELDAVHFRIAAVAGTRDVSLDVSDPAHDFLLREGTDARYGARHLKRAVERLVVQPISNLIASGQVQNGDRVLVDLDAARGRLVFFKEFQEAAASSSGTAAAAA
jgi:ATP-dependent Clp protease ATP-binding subunit ClpA